MTAQRVLLHVGTPKTGTSYLQDVLFRNRSRLVEHGILYPADRFDSHFLAGLDLMRLTWGGLEREAVGAWDRLAEQVRAWHGTAIVSHEILAHASRAHVRRALASLGADDGPDHGGVEIHLVVSARDLLRQVPAEWQENVKHRATLSYEDFLAQLRDPDRASRIAAWFWSVQEVPDILERWGGDLPPERVHVVTVPAPGSPKDLLWQRFQQAFGLEEVPLEEEGERANPSLGVPETALVRRINGAVNRDLPPPEYRPLVRELLVHQTLSARTGSPRLALPPAEAEWATSLSRAWVTGLREHGYDVVGDLEDLMGLAAAEWADPDAPDEGLVAEAGVDAIRALLLENVRLRSSEATLRGEVDDLRGALDRAYLRPSYRLRERIVTVLGGSGAGRRLLNLYRRLRGRSSPSA